MIPFEKMHGTGNDFVIIDQRNKKYVLDIKKIADRRFGVGCDQVIVIEDSFHADCTMYIYNPDGSGKAEACGNATRCVAHLIMEEKKQQEVNISIEEKILKCWRVAKNLIKVDMGEPLLDWNQIPLSQPCDTLNLPISYQGLAPPIAVNMGNPHVVFFIQDINSLDLADIGAKIENDALFPEKVNVNVAQITYNNILLKVWERGAGSTLACGSGACATLVAAVRKNYIKGNNSWVSLPGGGLYIEWDSEVFMTGEVAKIFTGIMLS